MQERYIASADLGTSKLALCVAKVTGENVQVIYYKERPSDGIRYGCVFNPKRAGGPLRAAIAEAEDELQIKILQLVVGLPRYSIRQETASAKIERSDPGALIEDEEINTLKGMALDTYPLKDRDTEMIYGAVPQSFSTDDVIGSEDDVRGTCSDTLAGNYKIFVGRKKPVRNLDIMLNGSSVALAQTIFTPAAVGAAVLKNDEMANGVALIEMGAGVTSLSIYQGGIMRYYASIPFGGKSVTMDIRLECAFDDALAENVKLAFGACLPEKLQTMGDKIIQINDEENGTYENLPVKYLSEIISSRCREIVQAMLFLIQQSGYADRLRCGIVLTGGGANLANLCNLVKEESGYNVRVGFPLSNRFSSDGCPGIGEAEAAASVGMILQAKEDLWLNCIEESAVTQQETEEDTTHEEDTAEEAENTMPAVDQSGQGLIFGEDEVETVKPARTRKVREPRTRREPKPAKEPSEKTGVLKILWQKVENTFSSGFDKALGSIYDEMGDENEQNA